MMKEKRTYLTPKQSSLLAPRKSDCSGGGSLTNNDNKIQSNDEDYKYILQLGVKNTLPRTKRLLL